MNIVYHKSVMSSIMMLAVSLGWVLHAAAHVPYLEDEDLSFERPFELSSPFQSTAVYAWLESGQDVDYYVFSVRKRVNFFAEVIVPAYPQYREFRPSFALIGKGLPAPTEELPVELAPGYGAIVCHDDGSEKRPSFREPFGGKYYYQGPRLERMLYKGEYTVIYWAPSGCKGDYTAVLGRYEIWRRSDIRRAIEITPLIRQGKELHLKQTACE